MKQTIIENGKISDTMLGKEDHGIMTFYLFIEFETRITHGTTPERLTPLRRV